MQSRLFQETLYSRLTIHRILPSVQAQSKYFQPLLYPKYRQYSSKSPSQSPTTSKTQNLWNRCLKLAGKQAENFKDKPLSYALAFLFLHEVTAILPLPMFYFLFHSLDWTPSSLPTEFLEKGAGVASRIFEKIGYNIPIEQVSRVLIDGAAAYACVKV
ncbi:mitochondrial expression network (MIOREX) component Mrx11 [Schizosaccharomyces osmophilus]|uniref:Mitochondrial expression network (MIOREX) component Mrx11 n=1 Tax=Schizosaccharomyces osmophilus TaxID=2545709 RepID=A0AAF0AVC0_9SCHI|nr:mitochondrial expression network (MIOREX) component Mrx11 [Schizosaccharomyces osmophilus]WBW72273.1 mitochondrial expression network (MIOREX) component Mrx11 [Schizosaccharomyces osmophilus]